jgi:putative ABC transport system ATP-binding protein
LSSQDHAGLAGSGKSNGHLIKIDHLAKTYMLGEIEVHALRGVSLEIGQGEFVAIMGASGSGKSTFMNILGCLDAPTAGTYHFRGVDVSKLNQEQRSLLRRYYVGFVFQGFNLMRRTTALENLELPLLYRGMSKSDRRSRAIDALARVGLAGKASHTATELSGGEQQRVAIARALVTSPLVLLADEPTGNLDSHRSHEIMGLLVDLNRMTGLTLVVVTHEEDIAAYARRQIRFRDGRVASDTFPMRQKV